MLKNGECKNKNKNENTKNLKFKKKKLVNQLKTHLSIPKLSQGEKFLNSVKTGANKVGKGVGKVVKDPKFQRVALEILFLVIRIILTR